jgi:hypothetical protein
VIFFFGFMLVAVTVALLAPIAGVWAWTRWRPSATGLAPYGVGMFGAVAVESLSLFFAPLTTTIAAVVLLLVLAARGRDRPARYTGAFVAAYAVLLVPSGLGLLDFSEFLVGAFILSGAAVLAMAIRARDRAVAAGVVAIVLVAALVVRIDGMRTANEVAAAAAIAPSALAVLLLARRLSDAGASGLRDLAAPLARAALASALLLAASLACRTTLHASYVDPSVNENASEYVDVRGAPAPFLLVEPLDPIDPMSPLLPCRY